MGRITQGELCKLLGLTSPYVSMIINKTGVKPDGYKQGEKKELKCYDDAQCIRAIVRYVSRQYKKQHKLCSETRETLLRICRAAKSMGIDAKEFLE